MQIRRFTSGPIIVPEMDARMGSNINGPSLVRAPRWLDASLGRYYLYFADHGGRYIRLAYADELAGPWRTYEPGTLKLEQTGFLHHIASPDVHFDEDQHRVRMYFHGCGGFEDHRERFGVQMTRVALSEDGLNFEPVGPPMGRSYWRVFELDGWHYTLEMPGRLRRSRDPLGPFEPGPQLWTEDMRHSAVMLDGRELSVFFSNAKDCPERILLSRVDVSGDWMDWRASEPVTVLRPELPWEGAQEPLEPSRRGSIQGPVHQLRDPAVFREDGRTFLLYTVAGEHGIGIVELV